MNETKKMLKMKKKEKDWKKLKMSEWKIRREMGTKPKNERNANEKRKDE